MKKPINILILMLILMACSKQKDESPAMKVCQETYSYDTCFHILNR